MAPSGPSLAKEDDDLVSCTSTMHTTGTMVAVGVFSRYRGSTLPFCVAAAMDYP